MEHENEIIQEKSKFKSRRKKVEIRKAKFKELWKYVEELTVVKRLDGVNGNNNNTGDSGTGDDDIADIVEEEATENLEVMFR
jgi:hypothetical protein